jgi:hypothetical protein
MNIIIKGLALCQLTEYKTGWRVFFPKAKDHKFKLIVEKKVGEKLPIETEYVFPTATQIDFVPGGTAKPVGNNNIDTKMPNIVDLHAEDVTLSADKKNYAGFLNLQGCTLKSGANPNTPQTVEIWDWRQPVQQNPSKLFVGSKTIHTEFLSQLVTDADSTIDIFVKNNVEINLKADLSLKQEVNVFYTLTFSNDCDSDHCDTVSDFKYSYNIIDETKLNTKRQFEFVILDPPSGSKGRFGRPCGGFTAPPADPIGTSPKLIVPNFPS